MPLVGYLAVKDPGRISTISNLPGPNKNRRKKIKVLQNTDNMYVSIYVRDCVSHDPPGALVPVVLNKIEPGETWKEIGIAKCCPLCWKIVVPPLGIDLPEPLIQPIYEKPKKTLSTRQRQSLHKGRRSGTVKITELKQTILNLANSGESFTTDEVIELSQKSRTAVRKALKLLVKSNQLVIVDPGGRGRGKSTRYQAP